MKLLLLLIWYLFLIFLDFLFQHCHRRRAFFGLPIIYKERSIFIFLFLFIESFWFWKWWYFSGSGSLVLINEIFSRTHLVLRSSSCLRHSTFSHLVFGSWYNFRSLFIIFLNCIVIGCNNSHLVRFRCNKSLWFSKYNSFLLTFILNNCRHIHKCISSLWFFFLSIFKSLWFRKWCNFAYNNYSKIPRFLVGSKKLLLDFLC